MSLGKAKTMLIALLLLSNLLMGGLLGLRIWDDAKARAESERQLIELLAAQGVRVTSLPDNQMTAAALLVTRTQEAEEQAVRALFDDALADAKGGGIVDYVSAYGSAQFRSDGKFEITRKKDLLNLSATARATQSALEESGKLLFRMGLQGLSSQARLENSSDGGVVITYGQSIQGRPVFNARADLLYDSSGHMESVGGWWCFGTYAPENGIMCKSAGAILLQFAATLDGQTLDVQDVSLGYRLKPNTPGTLRLSPEWRVVCPDRELYLDAFSATLSVE